MRLKPALRARDWSSVHCAWRMLPPQLWLQQLQLVRLAQELLLQLVLLLLQLL